ncbi:MAG: AMP-binding protein [Arenicellales bacterium]
MNRGFSTEACEQAVGKVFLQGSETVTYGQLLERIEKLATCYRSAKLEPGDRVLLAVASPARFSELFLSLLVNGLCAVIANPIATSPEVHHLIEQTTPRSLIIDHDLVDKWNLGEDGAASNLLFTVSADRKQGLLGRLLGGRGDGAVENADQYPALADRLERTRPPGSLDDSLTGWIIHTSGTTSDPKNVAVSRRALLNTLRCRSEKFSVTPDSKILNVLSLSQGDGLGQGPLLAFYNGATWVRPAEFQQRTLPVILDSIYTHRVTHFITVPVMMSLMMRLGDEERDCFDTGDFELVVSTAAALPETLWRAFEEAYGVEVTNLYALSECTTALFAGPDAASRRVGSLGRPYGCEIRIEPLAGQATGGPRQAGELWLRSASLMDGYLNNDRATSQCLVDGWLKTGDLVERDDEGFVWLTGRVKDMINFAGYSLNPSEIAEALESHPTVLEAAVAGVNHDEWGEIPVAVVVCRSGADTTVRDLMAHLRARLTEYKLPREIVFAESLPRTANGKLNAGVLLELYRKKSPAASGGWNERIVSIAQACFRTGEALEPDASPATVSGWDSLAHMEMILAVEREFSIRFTTKEIMTVETLGELTELVGRKLAER